MIRKTVLLCAAAALLLCAPVSSFAQSAEDIVAKNLAAKGGEAKLKAVQSVRQSGTINIQGQSAQMSSITKRPNLTRQDINMMGTTISMAFDGTKGWMLNPMMGAEPVELPAEQIDMVKDQSDIDGPLVDYKAKGSTVELVGLEDAGGKKAFHLRVTRKGLPPLELFIDSTTYLDAKAVTSLPGSGTIEVTFGDYRAVDGLMVPFSVKSAAAGMTISELKLDKVEFNVTLPPDAFKIKK